MTTTYLRTGAVANNGCVGGNASRASAIKPKSVVRVKFLLPYASPASTNLSWGGGEASYELVGHRWPVTTLQACHTFILLVVIVIPNPTLLKIVPIHEF